MDSLSPTASSASDLGESNPSSHFLGRPALASAAWKTDERANTSALYARRLDRWLHSEQHNGIPGRVLNFGQRICIAADVASALDYVHNQLTPPLIHCDLKPENILLDDDMTARLSDFGSAKFLSPDMFVPESLDDVGGTVGYMAPEYGTGYEISVGADAYSFGVLLLELLTGKRPTDDMFVDGLTLPIFSESMFPDRVAETLDPHMAHEGYQGSAEVWMQRYVVPLVALGLSCTVEAPKDRPGMKDVCAKLSAIRDAFLECRDDIDEYFSSVRAC